MQTIASEPGDAAAAATRDGDDEACCIVVLNADTGPEATDKS